MKSPEQQPIKRNKIEEDPEAKRIAAETRKNLENKYGPEKVASVFGKKVATELVEKKPISEPEKIPTDTGLNIDMAKKYLEEIYGGGKSSILVDKSIPISGEQKDKETTKKAKGESKETKKPDEPAESEEEKIKKLKEQYRILAEGIAPQEARDKIKQRPEGKEKELKIPEAKNLWEVLSAKNEDEKQQEWQRLYKIFSKGERLSRYTRDGKLQYLKLKNTTILGGEKINENSKLTFTIYDENGQELKDESGNSLEKSQTLGKLKIREWKKAEVAPENKDIYITSQRKLARLQVKKVGENKFLLKNADYKGEQEGITRLLSQLYKYEGVYKDAVKTRSEAVEEFKKRQETERVELVKPEENLKYLRDPAYVYIKKINESYKDKAESFDKKEKNWFKREWRGTKKNIQKIVGLFKRSNKDEKSSIGPPEVRKEDLGLEDFYGKTKGAKEKMQSGVDLEKQQKTLDRRGKNINKR